MTQPAPLTPAVKLSPYLNFTGNCEEAFTFYAKCLNGKILSMQRHGQIPESQQAPEGWSDKILHARLLVANDLILGADIPQHKEAKGFSVALDYTDPAEADRVYHALSDGAQIFMPMQETFWAFRFAMFRDRFGTPWMINCLKPDPNA